MSTFAHIIGKSKDGVSNFFEHNNFNIKKIENYIKEKYNEVALNHLKNQTIKELTLAMSNKSIGTTNPNSLSLPKEEINSLKMEIYFLVD